MQSILPYLLIAIMALHVAAPLVERVQGATKYELAKAGTDDAEGKDKAENEKESVIYPFSLAIFSGNLDPDTQYRALFPEEDHPVSESHALLPELPPEA